jgi:hypothetical protein
VQPKDDLVVICNIQGGIRGADIYIGPTPSSNPDPEPRPLLLPAGEERHGANADTLIRILRFWGEHKDDNPSYAYDQKFAQYRDVRTCW